jgi:hypothetical protein
MVGRRWSACLRPRRDTVSIECRETTLPHDRAQRRLRAHAERRATTDKRMPTTPNLTSTEVSPKRTPPSAWASASESRQLTTPTCCLKRPKGGDDQAPRTECPESRRVVPLVACPNDRRLARLSLPRASRRDGHILKGRQLILSTEFVDESVTAGDEYIGVDK